MGIFIERFFGRFESSLAVTQSQGLSTPMALSDNNLPDLHLARQTLRRLMPISIAMTCVKFCVC